jgi:uncharacterized protein (TIGR02266 family)
MELGVDVMTSDATFTGFSTNVSEGGLMVSWHEFDGPAPRVREKVRVSFSLPGIRESIEATAEVRWARSGSGAVAGLGVKFVELPLKSRRLLKQFVALRAPLAADA